jgi:hypothetical protein
MLRGQRLHRYREANGTTCWRCSDSTVIENAVATLLSLRRIRPCQDALFPGIPSQTFEIDPAYAAH